VLASPHSSCGGRARLMLLPCRSDTPSVYLRSNTCWAQTMQYNPASPHVFALRRLRRYLYLPTSRCLLSPVQRTDHTAAVTTFIKQQASGAAPAAINIPTAPALCSRSSNLSCQRSSKVVEQQVLAAQRQPQQPVQEAAHISQVLGCWGGCVGVLGCC
jgi:hypothetical protein